MMRDIWQGLLELLAPPSCAACDEPLEARADAFCACCALLVDGVDTREHEQDRSACVYGGPVAEAVVRLKYKAQSHHAEALAGLLIEAAESWRGRVDRVCVVPLHPRRLRERGYNQSALLARPVARSLGARFDPWLLTRRHESRTQVGATPAVRRAQLQGTFAARARTRGTHVLVLDDVRTTGATLDEARRALVAAGADSVRTLTLALARSP